MENAGSRFDPGPQPLLAYGAALLALVTGGIHLYLGAVPVFTEEALGISFYLMGLGYVVGTGAYFLWERKRLVVTAGLGYTVLLLVLYLVAWASALPGPDIGVVSKAVEVALAVVLALLRQRLPED